MNADGAWTLWALRFERCQFVPYRTCVYTDCQVDGLLSFLFFVLMAVQS